MASAMAAARRRGRNRPINQAGAIHTGRGRDSAGSAAHGGVEFAARAPDTGSFKGSGSSFAVNLPGSPSM